jgi:hypothetical protein
MAIDKTSYNIDFKAPVLPDPANEYDVRTFNQLNNTLRLYFNQLDKQAADWFLV